jgi:predicted Zn-dependent protease
MALMQPDAAIPHLRRAIELDPGSSSAQGALGEALLLTAKYEAAIPALKASLEQDLEGVRHFQLAQAYRETGQNDLATQTLVEYRRLTAQRETIRKELDREYPITPPAAAPAVR